MYELHHAARRGDFSRLRELLLGQEKAQYINAFDSCGYTPLMYAVTSADSQTVRLLLAAGASVHQECKASYREGQSVLALAVGAGDPEIVAALIEAGADIHYLRNGYDILIDAVHGRDILSDSQLLDLLRLLLANGARTDTVTSYNESVLRVLSRIGRFDAIQLLLQAGADEGLLEWTSLVKTVGLGTVVDLAAEIEGGASLEGRDYWERTAWLLAIQTGDVEKARLLLEKGADRHAVGRCSMPPLFYAIASRRVDMVRWLLSIGTDVEQVDEFETTPLMEAAQRANLEAVDLLLANGAMVDRQRPKDQTALSDAAHPEIARRLLAAGADPRHLSFEARRAILRVPGHPNADLLRVTVDEFHRGQKRRFGSHNAEEILEPFWLGMIRSGIGAYQAGELFSESDRVIANPIWCAQRFGQSLTFLPDGRIIQIGGEHEDSYDADFCIYNDVFVHEPDGMIRIFGYPESEFPCTDFHTATFLGQAIWIIGSLGYVGTRRYDETPVYTLDTQSLRVRRIATTGFAPGWIHRHRAVVSGDEICVSGGFISSQGADGETYEANQYKFVLSTRTLQWRKEASAD